MGDSTFQTSARRASVFETIKGELETELIYRVVILSRLADDLASDDAKAAVGGGYGADSSLCWSHAFARLARLRPIPPRAPLHSRVRPRPPPEDLGPTV